MSNWLKLEGDVCAVTGALGGMGVEICREFARNGANVVLLDLDEEKVKAAAATAVATGKADVFYADSPVAGYAISQTDGQLEALGDVEGVAKQGIAIKKGDQQLDEAVQKAVQKLMDDGTYMKILKHWGVESGALDKAEINPTDLN